MQKLRPADLLPLEEYAAQRAAIRERLISHRRARRLAIGGHCTLNFEDRETIRYQVQEMLRAERIFEVAGIEEELSVYNPLIPDGGNLKATMLIEYADPVERARQLAVLRGIERRCWLRVAGHAAVYALADEDLERETPDKTSAVHFLRWELTPPMIAALKAGAALGAGIDHPAYALSVEPVPDAIRRALLADLD
jgi:precorrin-3B methylase